MPKLSRRPRTCALLPAVLAAVTALLATACSSSSAPLDPPQGGTQCVSYQQGKPVTIGLLDLHNHTSYPVTVRSVRLTSAHNLRMTTAWLLPIRNTSLIGAGAAYPPTGSPTWVLRKGASGGVIGPGQDLNLVFGVTRVADKNGLAAGEVIVYTAGQTRYTLVEALEVVVSHRC